MECLSTHTVYGLHKMEWYTVWVQVYTEWNACPHTQTHPGIIRSHTACVASGVMSRGAGPVPPVVTTKQQP